MSDQRSSLPTNEQPVPLHYARAHMALVLAVAALFVSTPAALAVAASPTTSSFTNPWWPAADAAASGSPSAAGAGPTRWAAGGSSADAPAAAAQPAAAPPTAPRATEPPRQPARPWWSTPGATPQTARAATASAAPERIATGGGGDERAQSTQVKGTSSAEARAPFSPAVHAAVQPAWSNPWWQPARATAGSGGAHPQSTPTARPQTGSGGKPAPLWWTDPDALPPPSPRATDVPLPPPLAGPPPGAPPATGIAPPGVPPPPSMPTTPPPPTAAPTFTWASTLAPVAPPPASSTLAPDLRAELSRLQATQADADKWRSPPTVARSAIVVATVMSAAAAALVGAIGVAVRLARARDRGLLVQGRGADADELRVAMLGDGFIYGACTHDPLHADDDAATPPTAP